MHGRASSYMSFPPFLLQVLTTDRIKHDHLDLTPLRVWILLNSDLYRDLVENTNGDLSRPVGFGDTDRVVLWVERVGILFKGDETLETEPTL